VIVVHRLTHPEQQLWLNCDLIQTIEATPDTVISLVNASKLVVIETPEEVVAAIRAWRAGMLVGPEVRSAEGSSAAASGR
jgi:flagellar protein FlbD